MKPDSSTSGSFGVSVALVRSIALEPASVERSFFRTFHLGLGPLISWSFPNRPVIRAQIAQAGASADQALAQFDSTTLEALRQTETALSAYAREGDRNAALRRAQSSAARAADQAGTLYRFGRTDFLSLLTAQAALTTAQANLAASDALLVDRQVDVFKALGGGWQT